MAHPQYFYSDVPYLWLIVYTVAVSATVATHDPIPLIKIFTILLYIYNKINSFHEKFTIQAA